MTNQEIKDKYGIEPIMKEMWVWDIDRTKANLLFVVLKDSNTNFPYLSYDAKNRQYGFRNASEINPNDKEPKVGEKGYFWDDADSFYIFDVLLHRYIGKDLEFLPSNIDESFRHFSHEKQPWMK